MNVLILHGIGGHAGIHWQQWLHDELTKRGYEVSMPDLPKPQHPDRGQWLNAVTKAVAADDPSELVIVAHSLGVTTALDFAQQAAAPVRALICVSGMARDYGSDLNGYFLREREIDMKVIRSHVARAIVFYGDDDPYVTQEALAELADGLGVKAHVVHGGGHLNTGSGYTEFPALLEKVVELIKAPA